MFKTLNRLIQATFYIFAGTTHFLHPHFYTRLVPPWVPNAELANEVSGAAEILLGILLLIPRTAKLAAWGIIALLIAVFPANWHQYKTNGAGIKLPQWVVVARLPFQLVLIAWAYWFTRE